MISTDDGHEHTDGEIVKTLRQLTPSEPTFQVILDDRSDVWPGCEENLQLCFPYQYFKVKKEEHLLMGAKYPRYF